MYTKLFDEILKKATLKNDDIELCKTYFEPLSVSKGCILQEQNTVPEYLYFISSGHMRLYYFDDQGNEITTFLGSSNGFITPFLSFINQIKSSENVQCITRCELIKISHPNLKTLIDKSENFKKFSLIIFEHAIASTNQRANDLATLNGEQRYKKLLAQNPDIIRCVPIQHIASFLGMKPESLSRIRKNMIN